MNVKKKLLKRILQLFGSIVIVFCILSIVGWSNKHEEKLGLIGDIIVWSAEFPDLVKAVFVTGLQASNELLIENEHVALPDISGFHAGKSSGFILASMWDEKHKQSIIQLVRLNDSHVVYEWIPDLEEIYSNMDSLSKKVLDRYGRLNDFGSGFNRKALRFVHPFLSSDHSVVFNFMHGPLVCIDSTSKLKWLVNGDFHHSIEIDSEGNFWVPGVRYQGIYYDEFNIRDDVICKISPKGDLLFQKSVLDIFVENNLTAYEFGDFVLVEDLTHVNDIQPVMKSASHWQKDDLFISYRQGSTVFLYRPSANKVVWMKRGPWLYQHDVDIIDSACISIYGNDVFYTTRAKSNGEEKYNWLFAPNNEIYIVDFNSNEVSTPYADMMENQNIRSATEGRCEIDSLGNVFVEETNAGRYMYFNNDELIWQFVFKYSDHEILMPAWSRKLFWNGEYYFE